MLLEMVDMLMDNFAASLTLSGTFIEPGAPLFDLAALESRLPGLLPPSFRSMVLRYRFLAFEVKPLWFFGNTGEETTEEWRVALSADKFLSHTLLMHGYVQFARLDTGSYDPICFDTKRGRSDGEYPIVWIDHEGILCNDKILIRGEIAPSLADFVQNYLTKVNTYGSHS